MRGHILLEEKTGRRSIYVPEAHIQFYLLKRRDGYWDVCAYKTDGYYGRTREEAIPTLEHLRATNQWTAELEVPEHIVRFAVESERRRKESVEGIEQILLRALKTKDRRASFRELLAHMSERREDPALGEEAEHTIGKEIAALLQQTGGLQ